MSLGFVIVRHVNSEETNEYWKESYQCIREFYDNPIIIVDDASSEVFLKEDIDLMNCQVIKSEFPKAGEILGYYYFYKLRPFDKAVIIHDGVFFKRKLDFTQTGNVKFLWTAVHAWDYDAGNLDIIRKFSNSAELERLYWNKDAWPICFGVMSAIVWEFLDKIDKRHNLFHILLSNVATRDARTFVERIFPVVCCANDSSPSILQPYLSDIHQYCRWGISFKEYKKEPMPDLPIIKVWTGR